MVHCAVYGCYNSSTNTAGGCENAQKVRFFAVPTVIRWQCSKTQEMSTKRRAEWFRRINRGDINKEATHYKVCSAHFVSGKPCYLMDDTNPDWAPSLNLGHNIKAASNERSAKQQQRGLWNDGSP
ncbi:hypothetical protein HPB48_021304 [Haemaphysalis longicornis]|uniref:THAP-type domain-containing protein n=1 Tax=Haemaphysalis longicornis TaxID=44386 RepID=A0A9J6FBM6_HAELO|nr:hypothetical protein HPB48_021304 [Haemaphysalis longicornis]